MKEESITKRLARIESRIVQIMLHLGIDPYVRMYEQFDPRNPDGKDAAPDSSGRGGSSKAKR